MKQGERQAQVLNEIRALGEGKQDVVEKIADQPIMWTENGWSFLLPALHPSHSNDVV